MKLTRRKLKLTRRKFMHLATGAAVPPAFSNVAWVQQAYPVRPIRLIVGYPAGGPTDVIARVECQ